MVRHRLGVGAGSLLVGLLALVFAIALAACGGSSQAATRSTSSTSSTTSSGAKGFASFTSCLQSHGVPKSAIPSRPSRPPGSRPSTPPTSGAGGTGVRYNQGFGQLSSKYSAAFQACRSQLPTGNFARAPQNAAYRNCLQLHGVNLPAPGSTSGPTSSSTTISQSVLQQARQACASLRSPAPTSGGSSTPTT
jgi:hypothetical protein